MSDRISVEITGINRFGHGTGLDRGLPVIIPYTVTGDRVTARVKKALHNERHAELIAVERPSPHRVTPFCPLHGVCGGCEWQHIHPDYQLQLKQERVASMLGVPVEATRASDHLIRNKVQMPIGETPVSKRHLIGYFKTGSHEIVNIKHCPVHSPAVNAIIAFLREEARDIPVYNEKTQNGLWRHILIRQSETTGEVLVTFVVNADAVPAALRRVASNLFAHMGATLKGVCVNMNSRTGNAIIGTRTECILGKKELTETIESMTLTLGPTSFFQTHVDVARKLYREVALVAQGRCLDVYAGVGGYSAAMSARATSLCMVESNPESANMARRNFSALRIPVQMIEGDAALSLRELSGSFDWALVNPPRKGCDQDVLDELARLSPSHLVYASCHIESFARDAKILCSNGFCLERVIPFDMFPHTPHVETLAFFRKNLLRE